MPRLTLLRHGRSFANEHLSLKPWNTTSFEDCLTLRDSPLTPVGVTQAMSATDKLRRVPSASSATNKPPLILVSPLSRTLQTFQNAFRTPGNEIFEKSEVVACPLLAERGYMQSDVGTPTSVLKEKFLDVDFGPLMSNKEEWWYKFEGTDESSYEEWRPTMHGEKYVAPGEPGRVFHKRLSELYSFLEQREEEHIILVSSWGVLRVLAGRDDIDNCAVISLGPEEFNKVGERIKEMLRQHPDE